MSTSTHDGYVFLTIHWQGAARYQLLWYYYKPSTDAELSGGVCARYLLWLHAPKCESSPPYALCARTELSSSPFFFLHVEKNFRATTKTLIPLSMRRTTRSSTAEHNGYVLRTAGTIDIATIHLGHCDSRPPSFHRSVVNTSNLYIHQLEAIEIVIPSSNVPVYRRASACCLDGIPITDTYESLHSVEEYLVSSDSKVLKRLARHDDVPFSRCRRFRIDVQSLCAPLACATRAARLLPHNRQYFCLAPTSPTLQRETDTRPHGPRSDRESNRSRASSGDLRRRTQPRCSENVHD